MSKRTLSGEIRPRDSHPSLIGRLLEEDWFLRQVLSCLIDDGLHECRRVCRQWDAVCKTLPVKLRQVAPEHLSKMLATFPNAVKVSCSSSFRSKDLGVARQLAGMSSLKHLDQLGYFADETHVDAQSVYAETYTRLQSLGVSLDAESCESFRNAIPYLTGLQKLEVFFTWNPKVDPRSWTPFTELKGLRELSLSDRLLKNGSNEVLFPSTAVTKLTVRLVDADSIAAPELLATIAYYAGTVRSLNVPNVNGGDVEPSRVWTSLQFFGQLEMLNMSTSWMCSPDSLDSLFSVIASIDSLRSLTLVMHSHPRPSIGDVFCSLTNLQSLSLLVKDVDGKRRQVSVCVSQLTRLTSLTLDGVFNKGSIVPLNKLSCLSLRRLPRITKNRRKDLGELTDLTELLWHDEDRRRSIIPNHALSQLKRLQRLSLDTRDDLSPEAFQSLASLSGLTSLAFYTNSEQARADSFRMQFTVLTQLQELRLLCGGCMSNAFDVLGLFGEGTFPRLRYLFISHTNVEEDDEQMMFNRFPCLRSFNTRFCCTRMPLRVWA